MKAVNVIGKFGYMTVGLVIAIVIALLLLVDPRESVSVLKSWYRGIKEIW